MSGCPLVPVPKQTNVAVFENSEFWGITVKFMDEDDKKTVKTKNEP